MSRSILQQLFFGLMFPNLLEAGKQHKLVHQNITVSHIEMTKQYLQPLSKFDRLISHFSLNKSFVEFVFIQNVPLFLAESPDDDIADAMFKESCITEQTQYFFDNEERSYSGVLDCGNCSRYVGLLSYVQNVHVLPF